MGMNPYDFYASFVLPNFQDFCEEEHDVRKAFNAVVSVSHMTDNYYFYFKRYDPDKVASFKDIREFKAYLSQKAKYFNDIQSISEAYKHLYTKRNKPYVTIESGGAVTSMKIQAGNVVGLEIGGYCGNDNGKIVVIYETKDRKKLRLKVGLTKMVDFWQNMLDRGL
jgi:hypothetical protein